jgi:glutathione S-transferase
MVMKHVELFGLAGSTYVRTARMVCAEKNVEVQLKPLEFRADSHRALHPFLRMPVMRVGELVLYETLAIASYIDEAFDGPPLMPASPAGRARALQWVSTCSDYLYRDLVQALLKEEDPAEDALHRARHHLELVDMQLREGPFLLGSELYLCDLFLAPMLAFAQSHAAAPRLFRALDGIHAWHDRIASRSSFSRTQP